MMVALVVLALRPALFVVWVILNLMSVLGRLVMPRGVMVIHAWPRTPGDALATALDILTASERNERKSIISCGLSVLVKHASRQVIPLMA